MSEHTPGPWHWVNGDTDELMQEGDWRNLSLRTVAENRRTVCGPLPDFILGSVEEDEPNPANFALIAAAPDLLAALEMLMGHIDEGNNIHKERLYKDEHAIARAAIAKAKASEGER